MIVPAYLAHPLGGDVPGNLRKARAWFGWAQRRHPDRAFTAPWILSVETGEDDGDPAQREAGLARAEVHVSTCREIWLFGPVVSSGMQRELNAAIRMGLVARWDHFGLAEPPPLVLVAGGA